MVVLPGSSKFRFGRSVEAQSSACLFVPLAATVFPFDASGSPGSGESALGEPGVTLKVQELIERQPRHTYHCCNDDSEDHCDRTLLTSMRYGLAHRLEHGVFSPVISRLTI